MNHCIIFFQNNIVIDNLAGLHLLLSSTNKSSATVNQKKNNVSVFVNTVKV